MRDPESGSGAPKRQLTGSPHRQRKPLLQSWFRFLLLLSLVLFLLCYTLPSSSLSWLENLSLHEHYQKLFVWDNHVSALPSYRVHPKHKVAPTESPQTTQERASPAGYTAPAGSIQYHLAYPRNYHFILDNLEACKTHNPFLVLMVPVAPKNVAARDAIRKTWGKEKLVQGKTVLTFFMLGLSGRPEEREELDKESTRHHDIIQSDFMDTYTNLTIKTMVIMDWLATHCAVAAYGMKVDSDLFLNVDNLVIMLQKPDVPKVNYLTGVLMWNRPVVRTKSSKWYVPEEMYPDPLYPTYTLGMAYVFSSDLPLKYVEISKSIKPFNIEDAYIGMCMKQLGLAPVSPPDPSQFKIYNWKYDRCEYSKIITYILGSPMELVQYWQDLKKPGPPC